MAAVASLFVILRTDVIHGALALIVVLLSVAGIYAGLGGYFLAAIQVVVYAGAVVVLFLFAIMVLKSRRESGSRRGGPGRLDRIGALLSGGAILFALTGAAQWRRFSVESLRARAPGLSDLTGLIFGEYLLGFELIGLLLLVSLVAVVVLARKRGSSA